METSFENYLQKQKLRASTIRGHIKDVYRFKKWAEIKKLNHQKVDYNELLSYVKDHSQRGAKQSTINNYLNSIRNYYDYLISQGEHSENPASELRLKNKGKQALGNLLSKEEMEELYTNYQNKPSWKIRGKISRNNHTRSIVILGLMIYQAVQTTEIKKLEKTHLNLLQCSIYIPPAARGASRILKLDARQIVPLQNYVSTLKEEEKLFSKNVEWAVNNLIKELKKINPQLKTAVQIKQSVIMAWLRQYNIRQVQYMAGHKCISSTERYKQEEMYDLQAALNKFHPLK